MVKRLRSCTPGNVHARVCVGFPSIHTYRNIYRLLPTRVELPARRADQLREAPLVGRVDVLVPVLDFEGPGRPLLLLPLVGEESRGGSAVSRVNGPDE